MTAPYAIADICLRYQTGCKHVVSWVATTARTLGADSNGPPNTIYNRRRQQQTKKRKPKKPLTIKPPKPILTEALLLYAAYIEKKSNPSQTPPSGIQDAILVLRDVIQGRKEFAVWHLLQYGPSSGDESHEVFVTALETVHAHLKQALTNSATSTPLSAPLQVHRELFSNSYDLLTVDEPAESPTGWSPTPQESARPAKARAIVELSDAPEHSREFEIWCALRQGYDIRQHLLSLWKSTPNDKFVPYNASRILTYAAAFIRNLASDLVEAYPELKDFGGSVANLSDSGADTSAASELQCLPALKLLTLLRDAGNTFGFAGKNKVLRQGRALHPLFDLLLSVKDGLVKNATLYEEKLNKDVELFETTDPLLSQMMIFFVEEVVTLDMLLIVQIYMENHDSFQSRLDSEFERLSELVQRTHVSLERIEDADSGNALRAASGQRLIETVNRLAPLTRDASSTLHRCQLLQKFPTLSLVQAANLSELVHISGTETANFSAEIVSLAYIYVACRDAGNVQTRLPVWEDMDHILQTHAVDGFGIGIKEARGLHIHSAAKLYQRAFGVTALEQKRQRHDQIFPEKAGFPRTIVPAYRFTPKSALMATEDSELDMNARLGLTNTYGIQRSVLGKLAGNLIRQSNLLDDAIVRLWNERGQLTPVQLLRVMATALESQPDVLDFDYHGFAADCSKMMAEILELCGRDIYLLSQGQASNLPKQIDTILWEAVVLKLQGSGMETTSMLDRAAGVVGKFIAEE